VEKGRGSAPAPPPHKLAYAHALLSVHPPTTGDDRWTLRADPLVTNGVDDLTTDSATSAQQCSLVAVMGGGTSRTLSFCVGRHNIRERDDDTFAQNKHWSHIACNITLWSTTSRPSGLTVAHSFDPELFLEWGTGMGKEFAGKGASSREKVPTPFFFLSITILARVLFLDRAIAQPRHCNDVPFWRLSNSSGLKAPSTSTHSAAPLPPPTHTHTHTHRCQRPVRPRCQSCPA
jgi:hypothetical protein